MAFLRLTIQTMIGGVPQTVGLLYDFPNGTKERSLLEEIDDLFTGRLPPSRLGIVCAENRAKAIADTFRAVASQAEPRLRVAEDVQVLPYDHHGKLVVNKAVVLHGIPGHWVVNDAELEAMASDGLRRLMRETGVIMDAPLGYEFRKPSQDSSPVFVRAGNLVRELPILALTTHLLLRRFRVDVEVIYIDSFTILSIALAFQRTRQEQYDAGVPGVVVPRIESFHSYSIKDDFRFPVGVRYRILISASTSGNLGARLVKNHGANPSAVLHLIGYSRNKELAQNCVVFEEGPSKEGNDSISFVKEISIRGEEFMAAHSRPMNVQMTIHHFLELHGGILADQWYQRALCVRLAAQGQGAFCPFSFDGSTSLSGVEFEKWLGNQCEYSIPSNVGWILSTDDGRSLNLAKRIQSRLKKWLGRTIPVRRLPLLEHGDNVPGSSKDETVLICCAEAGRGDELLAASRFLRTVKHAYRYYLCGYLFPETRERMRSLERNLCVSGTGRDYTLAVFFSEAIGRFAAHESWRAELKLLSQGETLSLFSESRLGNRLQKAISERLKMLRKGIVQPGAAFLPKVSGEVLKLRPDSVLFPKGYGAISQVVVYYRVAAGLQSARDHKSPGGKPLKAQQCFHDNPFMPSVLDPDSFSRFNDGIIQSAILRGCSGDELNYSADAETSAQMAQILGEVFRNRERRSGEAALEFLLALKMGKLRLLKSDFENVKETIRKFEDLSAFWDLLSAEPEI